jgi:hypothetical protein
MLTLNNIEKLKNTYIGKWEVLGVEVCGASEHHINADHYNIRLSRNSSSKDSVGAAIQIERKEGEFGYNICVCYEHYDKFISITAWPKDRLLNKNNFLASMQGILDAEYDKRK